MGDEPGLENVPQLRGSAEGEDIRHGRHKGRPRFWRTCTMTLSRLVTYYYHDRMMLPKLPMRFFGCRHKRTTWPQRPRAKGPAQSSGGEVVMCSDCGRRFNYDWEKMQMGEEI